QFVDPLLTRVQTFGHGHLSEIADAEAPFEPKGCPFQAWSLGELLRIDRVVLVDPKRARRVRKVAQQAVTSTRPVDVTAIPRDRSSGETSRAPKTAFDVRSSHEPR